MRFFIASCLIICGAAAGGIFPGAVVAFWLAVASGLSGSAGEVFCFTANVVLGLGGSLYGALFARVVKPNTRWPYNLLFPVIAGLVAGVIGYLWLDWDISHANPPL